MAISLHTKLCDMLGIEYPVAAFAHCRDVVAAVSNGGGIGVLGSLAWSPEEMVREVNWLKSHTDKPFAIDLVFPKNAPKTATREQLLAQVPKEYKEFIDGVKREAGVPDELPKSGQGQAMELGIGGSREQQMRQLDMAVSLKPAFIACALGVDQEIVDKCHAGGVKVVSLVGNVKNARRVAALGVDIIVAQGTEAGGHTGRIGTLALVPQVVDAAKPVPVLAAGGIGDGRGLVAALALGAVGVWTGTIWLVSHENPLADWTKDKMIHASDEDAVITKVYTGKTARFLNNKFMEAWNRPGAPKTLPMPLQNLYKPMPQTISTENPKAVSIFDKPELHDWTSTAAGNVVGLIHQRKSARQILYDMVSQAAEILAP